MDVSIITQINTERNTEILNTVLKLTLKSNIPITDLIFHK